MRPVERWTGKLQQIRPVREEHRLPLVFRNLPATTRRRCSSCWKRLAGSARLYVSAQRATTAERCRSGSMRATIMMEQIVVPWPPLLRDCDQPEVLNYHQAAGDWEDYSRRRSPPISAQLDVAHHSVRSTKVDPLRWLARAMKILEDILRWNGLLQSLRLCRLVDLRGWLASCGLRLVLIESISQQTNYGWFTPGTTPCHRRDHTIHGTGTAPNSGRAGTARPLGRQRNRASLHVRLRRQQARTRVS